MLAVHHAPKFGNKRSFVNDIRSVELHVLHLDIYEE